MTEIPVTLKKPNPFAKSDVIPVHMTPAGQVCPRGNTAHQEGESVPST